MTMPRRDTTRENAESFAAILPDAGGRLNELVRELAANLKPFPAFMGMASLQAIELEPSLLPDRDLGCVVVTPEGRICQLNLRELAGPAGLVEGDQVEEFEELQLTDAEFLICAGAAIMALGQEYRKRGL